MLKRIGKKALPIIMATMIVAGMGSVSTLAVNTAVAGSSALNTAIPAEMPAEDSTGDCTIGETITEDYYNDHRTNISLSSDDLNLSTVNVMVIKGEVDPYISMSRYLEVYDIDLYQNDTGINEIDFEKYNVTLSLPCNRDDCYIIYRDYRGGKPVQLEAEYVNSSYNVRMPGAGAYMISEKPLAEGEGELIEQTLVDKATGVSVKGMIPTGSNLVVVDIADAVMDYMKSSGDKIDIELTEEELAMLANIDYYIVYVERNLNVSATEGELTVSLPNDNNDCEVRYIYDVPNDSELGDSLRSAREAITGEIMLPTMSDEEFAEEINSIIDSIAPVIESEYVDGNYVVNKEKPGYFIVASKGSVYATADHVKRMREKKENATEIPTSPVTDSVVDTPTQPQQSASEQSTAPTQATAQATTATTATTAQATTAQTAGKGAVATGNGAKAFALAIALGTATATILAFRKKRLSK